MSEGTAWVSDKGEARVRRGHPWVFRSDVQRTQGVSPGAVVRVLARSGKLLGFAFYSDRSEITLRVFERGQALPHGFLRDRITAAVRFRDRAAPGVRSLRLVHGEGDGLPSLIVDRYADYLVVQTLSQGTERHKADVVAILVELLAPRGVLERNDPRSRELEGLERRVGILHGGVPELVEVEEGGLRLQADLWHGQKTGLFLDQRENRLATRDYAHGRVLDGFSYDGGFALQVAAQASEVLAVDISAEAVARTASNAAWNGLTNVKAVQANVFDYLRELESRGERFDTVILDPPAFAKSKDAVEKAGRGYKEINLRALKLLQPGGFLITCSCSYHIHEQDLEDILVQAAADACVRASVVEKRRQSRDHPIMLGVPETSYLKCFILRRLP